MSLVETAARAKLYGLSYGQYCLRKEMGTLPPLPSADNILDREPVPEVEYGPSGAVKWSKELTDYVWLMYQGGAKPEEIARRTGIPIQKIYNKLKELRRNEQI